MIFKTAYFKSKAKTLLNENEINESIQTSNQEILNGMAIRGFGMDCRIDRRSTYKHRKIQAIKRIISNYHKSSETLLKD